MFKYEVKEPGLIVFILLLSFSLALRTAIQKLSHDTDCHD